MLEKEQLTDPLKLTDTRGNGGATVTVPVVPVLVLVGSGAGLLVTTARKLLDCRKIVACPN